MCEIMNSTGIEIAYMVVAIALCPIAVLLEVSPVSIPSMLLYVAIMLCGAALLLIGYASVSFYGGVASIRVSKLYARLTNSKQNIESTPYGENKSIIGSYYWIVLPAATFFLGLSLSYDIVLSQITKTGITGELFGWLSIFYTTAGSTQAYFQLHTVLSAMLIITLVGGFVAIAAPYMQRFKVTTVNGSSFHYSMLLLGIGLFGGVGLILTGSGFFERALFSDIDTIKYAMLVLLECALFYSAGLLAGINNAAKSIEKKIPYSA